MKGKSTSIRFPQTHHLRRMLGLNEGKLPRNTETLHFEREGLKFRLLPCSQTPTRRRPHRLEVECNACGKWMSAGRFNQHQFLHRDNLSELSARWLKEGR